MWQVVLHVIGGPPSLGLGAAVIENKKKLKKGPSSEVNPLDLATSVNTS
jgi:hypothetical protein